MSLEELKTNLETFGQQHLLQFWNDLNPHEKDSFESELKEINFENLQHALNQTRVEKLQNKQNENLKPIPSELKSGIDASSHEQLERYESKGLKAIQDGQVAVLLLAGGQGTRMGVNYPKGMYSVKLPSNKSLFQLQAERLIRVQELAGVKSSSSIHWYIMTSDNTKNAIESYFKTNDYFKLNSNNIHFFEQGTMPCFSKDGKVLLDQKNKISRSPDGNGGLYKALVKYDILDDLIRRGVKYIHVYCVDNILVRIADPVFIGYCIERNADCAAKVVKKVDPKENVGVICLSEEKFKVVEYSEISEENRNLRDVNNDLVFNAGNICNHFFTLDFLVQACKFVFEYFLCVLILIKNNLK
jgi:UDP-N-acetylglucosamine/UDP-N-acetylgalactosamine diphosphorylase